MFEIVEKENSYIQLNLLACV